VGTSFAYLAGKGTHAQSKRAGVYHSVRLPYDARRARVWRAVSNYLAPFVDHDGALLDLGAGYGDFSRFARAAPKWALDHSEEMTAYWTPEVQPLVQSVLSPLPLETASIATVFASNFFEHFTVGEIESILSEVRRVVRPRGKLVVVQPNFRLEPRRYFDDYTHKSIFTDTGFSDLLRALGWNILRKEARFLPFSLKTRLPVFEPLVSLYLALPFRPLAGQFLVVAQAP
jgi:ubiquinone/menaquinone biosynthesis C-methylase UbiE